MDPLRSMYDTSEIHTVHCNCVVDLRNSEDSHVADFYGMSTQSMFSMKYEISVKILPLLTIWGI